MRLTLPDLSEEDGGSCEALTVDGEDGVSGLEACGFCLGHDDGQRATEESAKEGQAGADVSARQILKVVHCTQVDVREGEERHKREECVLETSGFLQHKRLAAW